MLSSWWCNAVTHIRLLAGSGNQTVATTIDWQLTRKMETFLLREYNLYMINVNAVIVANQVHRFSVCHNHADGHLDLVMWRFHYGIWPPAQALDRSNISFHCLSFCCTIGVSCIEPNFLKLFSSSCRRLNGSIARRPQGCSIETFSVIDSTDSKATINQ